MSWNSGKERIPRVMLQDAGRRGGTVRSSRNKAREKGKKERRERITRENDAKWAEGSCLQMRSSWAFYIRGSVCRYKINMAGFVILV